MSETPLATRLAAELTSEREKQAPPPPEPKPSDTKGTVGNPQIRLGYEAETTLRRVVIWNVASTIAVTIIATAIWIGIFAADKTTLRSLSAQPSIRDQTKKWLASEIRPDYDGLNIFLHTTLSAICSFSPEQEKFNGMLRSMVSGEVVNRIEAAYTKQYRTISINGITQTFKMSPVNPADILVDTKTQKISVTVNGVIFIHFADSKRPTRTMDYQTKAIIAPNNPNPANMFPFYLEDLRDEKITAHTQKVAQKRVE
jgi:hypothetical protein